MDEPTTLYALTYGEYEQYGVRCLFTTRELAGAAARSDDEIEEFQLFNRLPRSHSLFQKTLWMREDGGLFVKGMAYEQSEEHWVEGLPAIASSWGLASSNRPPIGRWIRGHPERLRWVAAHPHHSPDGWTPTPVAGAEGYDKVAVRKRIGELRIEAQQIISVALSECAT